MRLTNEVVISDPHCGCRLGLCPPVVHLDDGGTYQASPIQLKMLEYWKHFWNVWVPEVTKGEPFGITINGDLIDGVHHGSTHQISHNLTDQRRIAEELLKPIRERAARLIIIRGTEAHGGKSCEDEEELAKNLGAEPNEFGQYSRYDVWLWVGPGLVHILHHIGTTGSNAYEATAVHKELVEEYAEAGRWREQPPDVIVRSHRHRFIRTGVPTALREGIAVVTPGWQAKTPFAWRGAGSRVSVPQFGGILIRQGDQDLFIRHKVWTVGRSKEVGRGR